MTEKELNKALRDRARELGLCDQWYREWDKHSTKQELIEKYLKGIDFCIEHDYPKLPFVRAYFSKDMLLRNGIFLDTGIDAGNLQTAVLLGGSKGELRYSGMRAGSVYVRHQSEVGIVAEDGAKVFVETYEDCKVSVSADETSKVFVYWHGGSIEHSGNVTVRDKRKAGV